MPIYEFRCTACDDIQEVLVSSSAAEVEMKCNSCQCEDMVRVLSRGAYSMGSSRGKTGGASIATKSCGRGNTCTTLNLPGHSR